MIASLTEGTPLSDATAHSGHPDILRVLRPARNRKAIGGNPMTDNNYNSPSEEQDAMRRTEATIIELMGPALNQPPKPDIETFLNRQRRVYQSLENLLDALIECVEGNTQFWGNDDEDYMNVRLQHINAYALHVFNGNTEDMISSLIDESFVHSGHEDDCPITSNETFESRVYGEGMTIQEAVEILKTCTCGENLYDRDMTVEHMTAALRIVTTVKEDHDMT